MTANWRRWAWVPAIPVIWGACALALAPAARAIDLSQASAAPSAAHWLGTDALGRDLLARTIVAGPLSIALAVLAVSVAVTGGIALGGACAIGSARSRWLAAGALGTVLAFPSLLVALTIVLLLRPGGTGAAIAIGIALIPGFARTVQTVGIAVADADYMAAARLLGVPVLRRLTRHLLPNVAGPLAVKAAADTGSALIIVAGFSFLGFGVQAPGYDWGRMLAQGLKGLYVTPLPALVPGIAVALTGLGFSALCDRLRGGGRAVATAPELRLSDATARDVGGSAALAVRGLSLRHAGGTIVDRLDLAIAPGEILGLIGESGSGKTSIALAIAGLSAPTIAVEIDQLAVAGRDPRAMTARARAAWLGRRTGFVFQDALSALNPMLATGRQIAERLQVHERRPRAAALAEAVTALGAVGLSDPARQALQRPAALSGGMRQRALIAMGLVTRPALLIADEPTTALDTTVQAQVIALLRTAANEGCAILFVSHELPLVADFCTRVAVLYAGRVVEILPPARLRPGGPHHPYTSALVACIPGSAGDGPLATIPGAVAVEDAAAIGCGFAPRCPGAQLRCRTERPALRADSDGAVACWFPLEDRYAA